MTKLIVTLLDLFTNLNKALIYEHLTDSYTDKIYIQKYQTKLYIFEIFPFITSL